MGEKTELKNIHTFDVEYVSILYLHIFHIIFILSLYFKM